MAISRGSGISDAEVKSERYSKIFRYLDKAVLSKIDITVVANDKKEAVKTIWDYFKKSTTYNIDYFTKKEIAELTEEIVFTEPKILIDESDCNDLEGSGYLKEH